MTVHLRVKGWLTAGAVVPCSPEAMAELVEHGRAQESELERLRPLREAADAWLKAYADHPEDSEECRDAHRALVVAVKGSR